MAKVNPPPQIRRPKKITADKELRPYFERLEWLLFQLWTRSGGGEDAVEDAQVDELFDPGIQTSDSDEFESELDGLMLEAVQFDPTELEDADVDNRRYALLVS